MWCLCERYTQLDWLRSSKCLLFWCYHCLATKLYITLDSLDVWLRLSFSPVFLALVQHFGLIFVSILLHFWLLYFGIPCTHKCWTTQYTVAVLARKLFPKKCECSVAGVLSPAWWRRVLCATYTYEKRISTTNILPHSLVYAVIAWTLYRYTVYMW